MVPKGVKQGRVVILCEAICAVLFGSDEGGSGRMTSTAVPCVQNV